MAQTKTNDTRVAFCDIFPHGGDKVHPNLHLCSRLSPSSSSTSTPDLDYSIGPSHHSYDFCNQKPVGFHLRGSSHITSINFPPSPPPTNSDPKRSVPLPTLNCSLDPGPSSPRFHRNICLEGTSAMTKHLTHGFQVPLTPPPTLPTPTLALPPANDDSIFMTSVDALDTSLLGLPSPSSSPDKDRNGRHLLSPISPEWPAGNISYETQPSFHRDDLLLCGNSLALPDSLHQYQPVSDMSLSHRPVLPPLNIPDYSSLEKSPSWDSSSALSAMDIDFDLLSTPVSPLSHLPPEKLDLEPSSPLMFRDDYRDEKFQSFPHPSPPPVHSIEFLPQLDLDLNLDDDVNVGFTSPDSPSLRLYALPTLEEDEDMDIDTGLVSPPSPGTSLLSLPGADFDDDLIPADLGLGPHPSPVLVGATMDDLDDEDMASSLSTPTNGLLLLDDTADDGVLLPRSPSPEPFDSLDYAALVEGGMDELDVKRLSELRKRSLNAERAARQVENAMLEQGGAMAQQQRMEARRTRKKEKERGREIGTMLKLKLAEKQKENGQGWEGGAGAGSGGNAEKGDKSTKRKKGGVRSMEQLVAKMLLRRNESYRSLVNRKTLPTTKFHTTSSPLARGSVILPEDDDESDDDEHDKTVALESPLFPSMKISGESRQDSGLLTPWTMSPLTVHSNY